MSLTDEYQALRHAAGVVDRSDRGAVLVTGPDAASFLQSLVSQDLDALADGGGGHSLLLTPQGKLDVDFRLLHVGDEWWCDCEAGFGAQLAASLNRFKIRVEVDVIDRSDDWGQLVVRGPETRARIEAATGVAPPPGAHDHVAWGASRRLVRTDWPGVEGIDVVGSRGAIADARRVLVEAGVAECGVDAYEIVRVEAGVARQGLDTDEKTIPQEAFLELDAVSFTKGCFLGQELVCRIDTRGHVNRFLRGVRVDAGDPFSVGAEVLAEGKVIGALTSVAASPELGPIALAMVRRQVEPPAEVVVRGPDGERLARIEALPLVT